MEESSAGEKDTLSSEDCSNELSKHDIVNNSDNIEEYTRIDEEEKKLEANGDLDIEDSAG